MLRPSPVSPTLSPMLLGMVLLLALVCGLRLRAAAGTDLRLARWRIAALGGALVLSVAVCVSPLATLSAHYLMTAHILQVTLLMGFVPPLLLLGLAGWRPAGLEGAVATVGRVIVHPVSAIVLVNAVFFGWHATPLYDACLRHEELYSLQLLSLLLVSIAFWHPIVEPDGRAVMGPFFKLGYILLATLPQTFAGLLFALAQQPFYSGYNGGPGALGMSPLVDQQIAGSLMAILSKVALFAAFAVVFARMLKGEDADSELGDDGGPGGGGDEPAPVPSPTPAWLGLLERGRVLEEPAPPPTRRTPTAVG